MKRIGILHVTDLHCGSPGYSTPLGDPKDKTVSDATKTEIIYANCMEGFYGRCRDLLAQKPVDLIACTGDLGYRNKPGTVEAGAIYLKKLSGKLNVKPEHVVVCPGNHDLQQKAKAGEELQEFVDVCKTYGFRYPSWNTPVTFRRKGLPVVALNTCLGGTEHALHDVPKDMWDKLREALSVTDGSLDATKDLPDSLKHQLSCMDIPAVGRTQMDTVSDYLSTSKTDTVVVLGHHSVLPTHMVEIRPYSQMVDAGTLLYRLLERGRRVIYLHGHGHNDCALTAQSPDSKSPGLLASIGGSGLHGETNATASYIQLLLGDKGEFLEAHVYAFAQKGSDFLSDGSYKISCPPTFHSQPNIDPQKLTRGCAESFSVVAQRLERVPDESLAEDLLKLSSYCQVKILDSELPSHQDWRVERL